MLKTILQSYSTTIVTCIVFTFNVLSFFIYKLDKIKAINQSSRFRESTLLLLSIFGPLGSIFGIWYLKHKTKKISYLAKWIFIVGPSIVFQIYLAINLIKNHNV